MVGGGALTSQGWDSFLIFGTYHGLEVAKITCSPYILHRVLDEDCEGVSSLCTRRVSKHLKFPQTFPPSH